MTTDTHHAPTTGAAAPEPHRSLWLEQAIEGPPAPPLLGTVDADVTILGGGYVGLWTALRIKQLDPSREVVVLERDVCGAGASGRNGGMAMAWWQKLPTLVALAGEREGLALARASERAVAEIGEFCAEHDVDAHFNHAGWIWTAGCEAERGAWTSSVAACERLGVQPFAPLSDAEVTDRTGSPVHLGGVFDRSVATVQPALLARGLRRVALERGVRIFERSEVRSFTRRQPAVVRTRGGTVRTRRVIVATNSWAASLREFARSLAVISSDVVATAPIPERLREIGWTGGEAITDSQTMVHYYRTTRDGRIVFGKGGWGLAYGGRLGPSFDRDLGRAGETARNFRRLYPQLAGTPLTHDWSGPIDRTYHGLPIFGSLPHAPHVLYGLGFSGNGVGPALIAGKILASLALDGADEWSRSPLVEQRYRRFPPKPITFAGAHVVKAAVARQGAAAIAGRRPRRIDDALASLAPAGLEDH